MMTINRYYNWWSDNMIAINRYYNRWWGRNSITYDFRRDYISSSNRHWNNLNRNNFCYCNGWYCFNYCCWNWRYRYMNHCLNNGNYLMNSLIDRRNNNSCSIWWWSSRWYENFNTKKSVTRRWFEIKLCSFNSRKCRSYKYWYNMKNNSNKK